MQREISFNSEVKQDLSKNARNTGRAFIGANRYTRRRQPLENSDMTKKTAKKRILFIHQNIPGQFPHLIRHYAGDPASETMAIGETRWVKQNLGKLPQGFRVATYEMPAGLTRPDHPYLESTTIAVHRASAVANRISDLAKSGFAPDIVVAHPGWGETLFVKDVLPSARLISYCEYFYRAQGQDVGFDPEYPATTDDIMRLRVRNGVNLLALDAMDDGIAPMQWQRRCFPEAYRPQIKVVHDGIDTDLVRPDANATFTLPTGEVLGADREIITFVNRNLEPLRGFHIFMRALPAFLRSRPNAIVVVVGGDEVSYGPHPTQESFRLQLLSELREPLSPFLNRIHFLGKIPYVSYRRLLQVSTAHVYLTYPFVLSWSMLEAMASGCLVIGSATPPVCEVIEHGVNGLLVDFFDIEELSRTMRLACEERRNLDEIAIAGRSTIAERFDLRRVCLPQQIRLVEERS